MADDGAPPGSSADGGTDAGVRELSELRDLLFGPERRQLDELRRRLDTHELSPEELAEQLPNAIALRSARDRQLALALAATVETAISESVRRNPQEIATAIFPVLGPAIRKAIAETMSGLVNAINRAIEHSLSPQGIRWRIEAWRTGVPFAQIVIRHALVYRVEQVFLIHCETGLVLAHAPEDHAEDADVISGMLTAIADFVNDSFEPRATGELRAFAAGDVTILVETGPQAYVAAVVRGQPPDTLLPKLQTTLETIHAQWSAHLAGFSGDAAPFVTTRPLLDECIETVLSTDRAAAGPGWRRFAWVVPAVLLIGALFWWLGRGSREWNAAVERLETEPGIVVVRDERSGGRRELTGLRDPLAANPTLLLAGMGIDTTSFVARWEPYISAEPALVLERARRALSPPTGVTLALSGSTIVATGRAPAAWIERTAGAALAVPGVDSIDVSRVTPGLPADMEAHRSAIEGTRVLFAVSSVALDDGARSVTSQVAARFADLLAAARRNGYSVTLQLVGRADPSGTEQGNMNLSRQRASAVRGAITSLGVPTAATEVVAIGSTDPLPETTPAERARLNRSVTFVVRASRGARTGSVGGGR